MTYGVYYREQCLNVCCQLCMRVIIIAECEIFMICISATILTLHQCWDGLKLPQSLLNCTVFTSIDPLEENICLSSRGSIEVKTVQLVYTMSNDPTTGGREGGREGEFGRKCGNYNYINLNIDMQNL